jgi:phosphoribosylformimino-5-aminoimidazole carboxamide ribotide isomerase
MIIIPAIDLKDGKCVRLRQGKMESATVFNDDPAAQAELWLEAGATRIHVVDLNGSIEGRPINSTAIRSIVGRSNVPVQLGGGIRDSDTLARYLDLGVETAIIGTLAAANPDLVRQLLDMFPGRVAIGVDAKSGLVAVQGWTQDSSLRAVELAQRFDEFHPAFYVYTDIARDGMMQGPNIEATAEFAQAVSAPVILSGGVSTMKDVSDALLLKDQGVAAIIIGRALYDGAIDLKEAIRLVNN